MRRTRKIRTSTGHGPPSSEWRRERLLSAGVPAGLARTAAEDARYDVHQLLQLIDRGCDPALAVRILAPIDEGGEA